MVKKRDLRSIASILRRDSIISTTAAGSGHPTSCLSSAEIMSCLFFSEMSYDPNNPRDPENDEFILSKGHAAPILYSALYRSGCIKSDLKKLRKLRSPLEGHPMPRSLSWVKVASGSLGQGLSVGLGFALAAKLQNRAYRTFVLLGDSEMAEGSNYEALQLAPHYKLNNLVAIIDVNRLGQRGETLLGHKLKTLAFRLSTFGWDVIEVNGHNVRQILSALKKSRIAKRPTAIIAKTFKGHGLKYIENKEGWHGKAIPEKDLEHALSKIPNPEMPSVDIKKPRKNRHSKNFKKSKVDLPNYSLGALVATREAYGSTLSALALSDSSVIATDAEVSNSTHSAEVKKKTPKQFIETFIAEQNLIGLSLGLSKKNHLVYASTFSAFLTRAFDQLRMAALSSASFTVSGSHAGVSIGEDGASQMGLEDIAMFRSLPNSTVLYPSDAVSTAKLLLSTKKESGIKYIRTTRGKTPVIYKNTEKFPLSSFKVLKSSKKDKAVLVGSGITLHEALKAHETLKMKGKNTAVIDLYCIKPFDFKKFLNFVKSHGSKIILAEDHRKAGGIGEMISPHLASEKIDFKHLYVSGIPHSGTQEQLLEEHKINARAIAGALK